MSGYVYLIGPHDWRLGRVKIGTTRQNPHARLGALQTGSPFELCLFGYFSGGASLERALHETFAPLRQHGEWFRLDHKLLDLVSNVYGEAYGERALTDREFCTIAQEVVLTDEPGFAVDDEAEWLASANGRPLSEWLADQVWASIAR